MNSEEKICQNCGRPFEWRKKWKDNWDEVKYCSKFCQGDRSKEKLKEKILSLLALRERGKTICPSEVLNAEKKKDKKEMEQVRMAARLLAYENKIEITQRGKTVDPLNFKGPIRLKLKI